MGGVSGCNRISTSLSCQRPTVQLMNQSELDQPQNSLCEFIPNWPRIWTDSSCRLCCSFNSLTGCSCTFLSHNFLPFLCPQACTTYFLTQIIFFFIRHDSVSCPSEPWKYPSFWTNSCLVTDQKWKFNRVRKRKMRLRCGQVFIKIDYIIEQSSCVTCSSWKARFILVVVFFSKFFSINAVTLILTVPTCLWDWERANEWARLQRYRKQWEEAAAVSGGFLIHLPHSNHLAKAHTQMKPRSFITHSEHLILQLPLVTWQFCSSVQLPPASLCFVANSVIRLEITRSRHFFGGK